MNVLEGGLLLIGTFEIGHIQSPEDLAAGSEQQDDPLETDWAFPVGVEA